MFKIGEIRELIRLLDETSVAELRIETDDIKLHMKKAEVKLPAPISEVGSMPPASPLPATMVAHHAPAPVVAAPQANDSSSLEANASAKEDLNVHIIKSPMVGTFYRAAAPETPSFVEIGAKVTTKSVVCIVEAMKLMNEIEAEVSGEVVEILAQNGQLVEYGQPLFKIRLA